MLEVHGLPRIEDDRTRLACQIRVLRAHESMEAVRDLVQPGAERAIHPWRGVMLAVREHDFAAEQLLASANHALGIRQAFRGQHAVAAPADMH